MNGAVVLLSGGLDSSANFFEAALTGRARLALTVDYGQRAAEPEIRAASAMAARFDVRHEVVRVPWLGTLGGSVLTAAGSIPQIAPDLLEDRATTEASARAVWVPNRNGVLIHLAAAFAERLGAQSVIVGFNREEAATFPDNSAAYLGAVTQALSFSTANQVRVECFTTALDKTEIVARTEALAREHRREFPWDLVWSCYEAGTLPCGGCESCRRLARARGKLA